MRTGVFFIFTTDISVLFVNMQRLYLLQIKRLSYCDTA